MTRVRQARQEDLGGLLEKERIPAVELAAIVERGRVLLAEEDGQDGIIGWLRWGLFWDEVPFMNLLWVDEPHRGYGVGRLLVGEWEGICGRDGHTLVLTSTVSAEKAQHFYRKLGYRDAGALLVPDEAAELFFLKQLGQA